ncbi:MAG: TonB-dependent receptor plug domain-containing protein [Prolixibacteraceae bacterium]|nr:TonB-dependent receptor plug domain-containing protein [Prolixibacteraceae bacterium]MBN2648191.1 TonB-dependent receptor plug domain-containing protein [Prolixibacteraceae bacterium]
MKRTTAILLLIILLTRFASAQHANKIHIEAKNKTLSSVLLELRDRYDYQFSYSENELSKYKINVSQTFNNKTEAINYLLKPLPFKYKKNGDVFIIIPDKKKITENRPATRLSGTIVDFETYEPLPYSHIIINNRPTISDVNGAFAFTASADTSFNIMISHLGYFILDTLISEASNYEFKLKPSPRKLPEIRVSDQKIDNDIINPRNSGAFQLNRKITAYLPGQGDNAVYNHLRLMPGVQAAGEQSSDLILWGSSNGQSRIIFDGFVLFGLKNYNDNIGTINPFILQGIEIIKGGADARYGNHVGGIVNIIGKSGSTQKPAFNLGLSNTTLNAMAEIPLFGNSSLIAAYRQTFYNVYRASDFNIFAPTRPQQNPNQKSLLKSKFEPDIAVYPDEYTFRDFNLKYTLTLHNGDKAYASFYAGGDYFSLLANATIERELPNQGRGNPFTSLLVDVQNNEKNKQHGFAATYAHRWNNANISRFSLTRSGIATTSSNHAFIQEKNTSQIFGNDSTAYTNKALEQSAKFETDFSFSAGHTLHAGFGITNNTTNRTDLVTLRDTLRFTNESTDQSTRFFGYLDDYWPINSNLIVKPGFRFSASGAGQTPFYFEPRLNSSYKLRQNITLKASWGMYKQFLYKQASVDKDQNYTWTWITHNDTHPVLKTMQRTAGINLQLMGFTVNVDAYYKTTQNISRRYFTLKQTGRKTEALYETHLGDSRSKGIDFYLHRQMGKHMFWVSYSLSETTERLAPPGATLPAYSLSPFNQQHELKLVTLFNIKNFYLSANYVYGSGLELFRSVFPDTENLSYHRFDTALSYQLQKINFTLETGLSILNLFDTQNLKHENLVNLNFERNIPALKIFTDAVPFTPMVYVNIAF